MVSSLDVARYLIHLAAPSEDEDVDCLCHLRLQKLLYYTQGWHLAAYGTPLFGGRIEAWTNGPVVKEVYPLFRDYTYHSIPPKEGDDSPSLPAKVKTFVRTIWEEYKQYSASALRQMTHNEAPWRDARGNLGPNESCHVEIKAAAMRAYFHPKLTEKLQQADSRINKETWEESLKAIESGRVHSTQEIRRELHSHRPRPAPE